MAVVLHVSPGPVPDDRHHPPGSGAQYCLPPRHVQASGGIHPVLTPRPSGVHSLAARGSAPEYDAVVTTVLVVEDEPDIRHLIRELLERAGHAVVEAEDGRVALRRLFEARPDLVILDLALPSLDGWSILERIRDLTATPVLILTARTSEIEKVRGLRAGADDYVTKPFGRQELVARVDALLRRAREGRPATPESYVDERFEVDFKQSSVSVDGRQLSLTPLEFRLLSAFVRHPNQVLSSERLLELVWGGTRGVSRDQVKLYVGYLRRKLGGETGAGAAIETVRGFGYRYRASPRAGTGRSMT